MLCGFDFDGTLADSKAVYYKTIHHYADKHHLKLPSQPQMDMAFGSPTPPLFHGWGNPEELKKHLDEISDLIDKKLCEEPTFMPLFPGVYDLLTTLKNTGITLAIITSRELAPLLSVMEAHKILSFFKTIRSSQDLREHGYRDKPYPDLLKSALKELKISPKKTFMIGDTWMDIKMAQKAHVTAVGVTWGYQTEETLRKYNADIIVQNMTQLKRIIK